MKEGVYKVSTLSENLTNISKDFIGLTGKTFLERQCKFHLSIELNQIDKSKLDELAKWCEVSGSLIIGEEKAKSFREKILTLK